MRDGLYGADAMFDMQAATNKPSRNEACNNSMGAVQ